MDCRTSRACLRAQPHGLMHVHAGHGKHGRPAPVSRAHLGSLGCRRLPPGLRPPRGQGPSLLPCPSHAQPGPGSQWAANGCKGSRKRSKRDVPSHAQQHLWPPGPWVGLCGAGDTGLRPQAQALPLPFACAQGHGAEPPQASQGADHQLLHHLRSQEERGRKAAITILTGAWVRGGGPLRDSLSPLVRLPQPPPEPHQDLTCPTNPSHPSFPPPAPWGLRSGASGWVRTSQAPLSLQPGGTVFPPTPLPDDSRSHPWDREAKRAVKE